MRLAFGQGSNQADAGIEHDGTKKKCKNMCQINRALWVEKPANGVELLRIVYFIKISSYLVDKFVGLRI